MSKLSVTATGILAGSAALFLLGLALEKVKTRRLPRSPAPDGTVAEPEPVEGPAIADADAREAWPFPTAKGQKLP